MHHYFWLLHVSKEDNWCVAWQQQQRKKKKKSFVVVSMTLFKRGLSNYVWLKTCLGSTDSTRFDGLDLFHGHRCVRIIKCKSIFRFLSTVLKTLLLHTFPLKWSCRVFFMQLLCVLKGNINFFFWFCIWMLVIPHDCPVSFTRFLLLLGCFFLFFFLGGDEICALICQNSFRNSSFSNAYMHK